MHIMKNTEIKHEIILKAVLLFSFTIAGFIVENLRCAVFIFVSGILIILINSYFLYRRYRKIAELSSKIDEILHGNKEILINDSHEGELAILNSEIRKMTIRLSEQSDQLMEEKVRLTDAIADIFHQLRTPLTSMNIVTAMLSEENLTYERRVSMTRDMKRQLERIHWLVESLLKISKIDAKTAVFNRKNISVKELVSKAAEPFKIAMELRCQEFLIDIGDEQIFADLSWTTEAIGNLLKNCMEHTREEGQICVSASETVLYTEIVISDTGEGFYKDDIPYLFDRFYKGKNAVPESIGIGLALSRSIISEQDGTIKAQNSGNGGAEFIIRFYKNIV